MKDLKDLKDWGLAGDDLGEVLVDAFPVVVGLHKLVAIFGDGVVHFIVFEQSFHSIGEACGGVADEDFLTVFYTLEGFACEGGSDARQLHRHSL